MHDTGAALGRVATDMGAGQSQIIAKKLDEERPVLNVAADLPAVHCHCYACHRIPPGNGWSELKHAGNRALEFDLTGD
jgi:hypothetical protein